MRVCVQLSRQEWFHLEVLKNVNSKLEQSPQFCFRYYCNHFRYYRIYFRYYRIFKKREGE